MMMTGNQQNPCATSLTTNTMTLIPRPWNVVAAANIERPQRTTNSRIVTRKMKTSMNQDGLAQREVEAGDLRLDHLPSIDATLRIISTPTIVTMMTITNTVVTMRGIMMIITVAAAGTIGCQIEGQMSRTKARRIPK